MRARKSGALDGRAWCTRLRLALCLLLLVLVLPAGCSFPGSVRPTVKIGLVAPFEGRYRYIGYDVIYAVRLALREVNSAGGIGGYNVELVAYDDGGDPALALQQARKLAIDPQVVAVIGHFRDETTLAGLDVYQDAGIPLIAPGVLASSLTDGRDGVFRLGPPSSAIAEALVGRIVESGHDSLAVVGAEGALGSAILADAELRGVGMIAALSLDGLEWEDGAPFLAADAIVCDAGPLVAGEVVVDLRAAGFTGWLLGGPSLLTGDFAAVAGSAADGVLLVTPWPLPSEVEGSDDFRIAYQDMGYHVSPPGPLALPAYEATWLILEALERDIAAEGEPTGQSVSGILVDAERSGLLGRIAFDGQGDWADAPLYWYELGSDGLPRLSSELSTPLRVL